MLSTLSRFNSIEKTWNNIDGLIKSDNWNNLGLFWKSEKFMWKNAEDSLLHLIKFLISILDLHFQIIHS